jgi:TusA-related sulfurtransferase
MLRVIGDICKMPVGVTKRVMTSMQDDEKVYVLVTQGASHKKRKRKRDTTATRIRKNYTTKEILMQEMIKEASNY